MRWSDTILIVFCIVMTCVANAGSAGAAGSKRVALVIGNSAYQHAPALANPKHDATDITAVLKNLQFEVVGGYDLDKTKMERAIRDFASALRDADLGIFFYAGHGLQISGENYLVPTDAKLSTADAVDFEMIPLTLVQRVMERAAATNVIFLDACRNNPLARNLARAMGTRSVAIGRGLAVVESGVGTLISFSTQPGNVALDGTGRNSPFAKALVGQLATSREDLSTMLIGVRNEVMSTTGNRQVPWEHSALTARLYLHDAPGTGVATPSQTRIPSDAAQVWSAMGDTTSPAVFRAFIAKFDNTVFADLARARLKELEEDALVPAGLPDPGSGDERSARTEFDGVWRVSVGFTSHCPKASWRFKIKIRNGRVSGGSRMRGGSVDTKGKITFEHFGKRNPSAILRYAGRISGDSGRATLRMASRKRKCRGAVRLKKLRELATSGPQ